MKKWFLEKCGNKKSILNYIVITIFLGIIISIITPLNSLELRHIKTILLGFPILSWFVLPVSIYAKINFFNDTFYYFVIIVYWPFLIFLVIKLLRTGEKTYFIIFAFVYLVSCYGIRDFLIALTTF